MEEPTVTRSLLKRTRKADLERELAALRSARARLDPDQETERRTLGQLIRCRERLRRRLGAGLPAHRAA